MTYVNYLSYNVYLLKVGGLLKSDRPNKRAIFLIEYPSRIFCNTLLGLAWVSLIYEIFDRGVFDFTSNALGYSFFGGVGCCFLRALYFCANENKTKLLVQKMNTIFKFQTETLLVEKSMGPCLKMTKKLTYFWVTYAEIVSLLFTLYPFYTGMWKNRVLPLPMWMPYDYKISPFYEITCAVQACALVMSGWVLTSMDTFFTTVLLLTAEQFKLLGWEFKNLLYTNLVLNGISKENVCKFQGQFNSNVDDRKFNDSELAVIYDLCDSKKFDDSMVTLSKKIISHHQSLLLFCTELEKFFSPMLLIYFSFFICAAMFISFAVISAKNNSAMIHYLPINLGIYLEILFPCLIANILAIETDKLQKELYEMPWYMSGKKFKTNYKFLLHKVNMPITITVGKFANLNLPLFLWAARTINSYCIVLYQFYQSE